MKWIPVILLWACACFAQPYEPIILLDVTGEPGERIGAPLLALGDQDGDGNDDLLTWVITGDWTSKLRLYYGTEDNEERFLDFAEIDTSVREGDYFWAGPEFSQASGDVDGDGHRDIQMDLCYREGSDFEYISVLFRGGPGIFDEVADWFGVWSTMEFPTNLGDYNGDGYDDLIRYELGGNRFGFYPGGYPPAVDPLWFTERTGDLMGNGDFNGDGYSDFAKHASEDLDDFIELYLGSPEADSVLAVESQPFRGAECYGRIVGDINGDSYDDIICYRSTFQDGPWKVVFFGSEDPDLVVDMELHWPGPISQIIPANVSSLGDINDDGYDDYAHHLGDFINLWNITEVQLGGNPLPPVSEPAWRLEGPIDEVFNHAYRIGPAGDFNGDGINDWMFSCQDPENRGRIIVVAGDRNFGLPATEHPVSHPSNFTLHPCFPNPFNPTTTIFFTLPHTMNANISVYNLNGQRVTTLADERLNAGEHSVTFDGSGLPSGVYFTHLTTGAQMQTQKMVLLK